MKYMSDSQNVTLPLAVQVASRAFPVLETMDLSEQACRASPYPVVRHTVDAGSALDHEKGPGYETSPDRDKYFGPHQVGTYRRH